MSQKQINLMIEIHYRAELAESRLKQHEISKRNKP